MSIQAKFASGLRWIGTARLAGQILSWIGTLFVMRLLAPGDYGLAAICSAVIMLAALVAELGFGAAIVQAAALNRDEVRSVFGAALLFAVVCVGTVVLAAPYLAAFYRAPEVAPMIQLSSATLLLGALSTLPDAYLRRDMAFVRISLIEFCTGLTGTITTVALAVAGVGVWALIVGPVVAATMRTVATFLAARIWVTPNLRFVAARRLLGYGLRVTLSRMASFMVGQSDVLIAGRLLSKGELGVYSIAMHLAMLPISKLMGVLNAVAFPAIADLNRRAQDVRPYLLRSLRVVGHVVVPMLWGLGALSPALIPVLIGPNWDEAVRPLQIVCLVLPLRLVGTLLSTTLQGLGEAGLDLQNTLTGCVLLPPMFGFGALFGAQGLAAAWLVGLPLILVTNLWRSRRVLGFAIGSVLRALSPALLCSGAMALAVGAASHALGDRAATPLGVGLLCLLGAVVQVALLALADRTSLRAMRDLLPRRT